MAEFPMLAWAWLTGQSVCPFVLGPSQLNTHFGQAAMNINLNTRLEGDKAGITSTQVSQEIWYRIQQTVHLRTYWQVI